ncbi:MAG: hypothetical protein WCA63_05915 [Gallionella sp.]|jgi:hypothetical protein
MKSEEFLMSFGMTWLMACDNMPQAVESNTLYNFANHQPVKELKP